MIDNKPKRYRCGFCGEEFVSIGYNVCNCPSCRPLVRNKRARDKRELTGQRKKCKVCSREFLGFSYQKYCSAECMSKVKDLFGDSPEKLVPITIRLSEYARLMLMEAAYKLKYRSVNKIIQEAIFKYLVEQFKDDQEFQEQLRLAFGKNKRNY